VNHFGTKDFDPVKRMIHFTDEIYVVNWHTELNLSSKVQYWWKKIAFRVFRY